MLTPINFVELTPQNPSKAQIQDLQSALIPIRCQMPEAEHFFAPGMYGRRFTMPAGMLVVGKIHKHAHLMSVIKGRAIIVSEFGRELVEAGHVTVSPPGVKRVVLALEDVTFLTIHHNPDDVEDLTQLEQDHIEDENFNPYLHQAVQEVLP